MSAIPENFPTIEFARSEEFDAVVAMSYQHFAEHGQHLVMHGYPYNGNSYQVVVGRDVLRSSSYFSNWDQGCITLNVPEYYDRDDPNSGCLLETSLEIDFVKFDGPSIVRAMFFNAVRGRGGGIVFHGQADTSTHQLAENPQIDSAISPSEAEPSTNNDPMLKVDNFGAPVPTILLAAMHKLIVRAIYA